MAHYMIEITDPGHPRAVASAADPIAPGTIDEGKPRELCCPLLYHGDMSHACHVTCWANHERRACVSDPL